MKKLLIASAALALSTSFAFASSYHHAAPPSVSFALTTGNNTSKIVNANVASKGGAVWSTNVNVVTQNSGVAVVPIGLFSSGLAGGN